MIRASENENKYCKCVSRRAKGGKRWVIKRVDRGQLCKLAGGGRMSRRRVKNCEQQGQVEQVHTRVEEPRERGWERGREKQKEQSNKYTETITIHPFRVLWQYTCRPRRQARPLLPPTTSRSVPTRIRPGGSLGTGSRAIGRSRASLSEGEPCEMPKVAAAAEEDAGSRATGWALARPSRGAVCARVRLRRPRPSRTRRRPARGAAKTTSVEGVLARA